MALIKVDTITNVAGTGSPTFTYHINKVSLKYTGAGGDTIGTSMTTIPFGTSVYDTNSAYSAGVFTAPKTAKYHFRGGILTSSISLATSGYLQCEFQINGSTSTDAAGLFGNGTAQSWALFTVGSANLTAGDTLRFRALCSTSTTTSGGAAAWNVLEIWEE